MIEEFKIGDTVVITSSNIDDDPYFQKASKIGEIKLIDKTYPFPYYVLVPSYGWGAWSKVRALTLLERELEDV